MFKPVHHQIITPEDIEAANEMVEHLEKRAGETASLPMLPCEFVFKTRLCASNEAQTRWLNKIYNDDTICGDQAYFKKDGIDSFRTSVRAYEIWTLTNTNRRDEGEDTFPNTNNICAYAITVQRQIIGGGMKYVELVYLCTSTARKSRAAGQRLFDIICSHAANDENEYVVLQPANDKLYQLYKAWGAFPHYVELKRGGTVDIGLSAALQTDDGRKQWPPRSIPSDEIVPTIIRRKLEKRPLLVTDRSD